MDQNNTIEESSLIYETFVTVEEQGFQVRVGFQINDIIILAGGIVELDFIIENQGDTPIYFLGGGSSSKKRPDYLLFDGFLQKRYCQLKDPMQNVAEIGGPVGAIKILSGDSLKQKLILNQFLTLEDLYNILGNGEKDTLKIKCHHHLVIGKTENNVLTNEDIVVRNVKLGLNVQVLQDMEKLTQYIRNLTAVLKEHWEINSTIEEERSIQRLTAIRIPIVIEYLEQLLGHPNISFNFQIQSALTTLKNKNYSLKYGEQQKTFKQ